MIYRFRIILDTEQDVFRDIEIEEKSSLEVLHNTIIQSFGLDGHEMASFYTSDEEWNQGEEISILDTSDFGEPTRLMQETKLEDVVHEAATKLIYIYDFMNMWTFMIELAEIVDFKDGKTYPNVLFVHGQLPDTPPEKKFVADIDDQTQQQFEFTDLNPYEDMDFNENWN